MDERFAREAGIRLAQAVAQKSIEIESDVTKSGIYPYPIEIPPVFRLLDPLTTLLCRDEPRAVKATPSKDHRHNPWGACRVFMSSTPSTVAPSVLPAGLAGCTGPLSFEAVLTGDSLRVYLVAQTNHIGFYADAWHVAYPEGRAVPADDPLAGFPPIEIFFDLYSPASYDRLVTSPNSLWPPLVRFAPLLGRDGILVYQVIFLPLRDPWGQNMANLSSQRPRTVYKRLDEPVFAAVIRIATTQEALGAPLSSFIGRFTSAGMPFRYRSIDDFRAVLSDEAIRSMLRDRSTRTIGQILTASELGEVFVHPPNPETTVGVHLDVLKGLSVPARLCKVGLPLGTNRDRGEATKVLRPLHETQTISAAFPGITAKGKSTTLANWAVSAAGMGIGCCVIDPHGPLVRTLAGIPELSDRAEYWDFGAVSTTLAYNALAGIPPSEWGRCAGDVLQTLKPLFETEGYNQVNQLLFNGLSAQFACGWNIAKLQVMYSLTQEGENLRREIIERVQHEPVRRFWREEFPILQKTPRVFSPISNRLVSLLGDEQAFRIFNQQTNRVDLAGAMRDGRVILVDLHDLSIDASRIIGGLLIGQIKHLAFRRNSTQQQRRFILIVDEFHRFEGAAFHEILDQTNKFRLSLWLAHQTTRQIPSELSKTIFGIDTYVFGVSEPDSKIYASLFRGQVPPETLATLPTGSVYARIGEDLVNFECPPPLVPDPEVAARLIAKSYELYYEQEPIPPAPSRKTRVFETFD